MDTNLLAYRVLAAKFFVSNETWTSLSGTPLQGLLELNILLDALEKAMPKKAS
jgi:hypothetical protein